ncbi:MAG: DUF58 domain-containing protein [Lachnospiraceae bacterium]|nr:DUF58 domain-containing protein [Lachnospiraceae bacterium]
MKKNRILMLLVIIMAFLFAGFFGGAMSYTLLYMVLILPFISFLYLIYVYLRFRLYQEIDATIMVKGEEVKYRYVLSNEDFIFYKSLKIIFLPGYSQVVMDDFQEEVALLPGEKHERQGRLICLYRGEYKVGIDVIVIQDLLNLFALKVKRPSTISARVYPRIIKLNSLAALNFNEDAKNTPLFMGSKKERPDVDMRSYLPGDDLKIVNWKITAKYQELYVRPYTETPQERILIYFDVSRIAYLSEASIMMEDFLLETTLAILYYYARTQVATEVIYYTDSLQHVQIKSLEDFNFFYDTVALLKFNSKVHLGALMAESLRDFSNFRTVLAITADFDASLVSVTAGVTHVNTCIILLGKKEVDALLKIRVRLGKTKLIHLPIHDSIANVLEKSWDSLCV